ncbi:MAG: NRDE family protein, partial [Vibrio anguillarum]
MCSVSWLLDKHGYHLFFNRDEQKNRPLALPPKQYTQAGVEVLMPIDPAGGGSWISLNECGLALCLLNNYQGKIPQGTDAECLVSRGQLLKHLSSQISVEKVIQAFTQLNLQQFASFTLLAFDPDLTDVQSNVMALAWNGEQSQIAVTQSPLFSSSVDLEQVQRYRSQLYQALIAEEDSVQQRLKFHAHHHVAHPHWAPCMHRQDA